VQLSVFVTPQDFKTSIRFTMDGDSPYKVLPAVIVSTYHAFLLQVAARSLDVRHHFLWRRVGGAAADSPSHFSSLWAPGEARSRRRTRVKQAQNGWPPMGLASFQENGIF
jgi:hypothetical protein